MGKKEDKEYRSEIEKVLLGKWWNVVIQKGEEVKTCSSCGKILDGEFKMKCNCSGGSWSHMAGTGARWVWIPDVSVLLQAITKESTSRMSDVKVDLGKDMVPESGIIVKMLGPLTNSKTGAPYEGRYICEILRTPISYRRVRTYNKDTKSIEEREVTSKDHRIGRKAIIVEPEGKKWDQIGEDGTTIIKTSDIEGYIFTDEEKKQMDEEGRL